MATQQEYAYLSAHVYEPIPTDLLLGPDYRSYGDMIFN